MELAPSTETQWKGAVIAAPGLTATVLFSRTGEDRGKESTKLLSQVPHLITKVNLTG